jgi:hypothetical protein
MAHAYARCDYDEFNTASYRGIIILNGDEEKRFHTADKDKSTHEAFAIDYRAAEKCCRENNVSASHASSMDHFQCDSQWCQHNSTNGINDFRTVVEPCECKSTAFFLDQVPTIVILIALENAASGIPLPDGNWHSKF